MADEVVERKSLWERIKESVAAKITTVFLIGGTATAVFVGFQDHEGMVGIYNPILQDTIWVDASDSAAIVNKRDSLDAILKELGVLEAVVKPQEIITTPATEMTPQKVDTIPAAIEWPSSRFSFDREPLRKGDVIDVMVMKNGKLEKRLHFYVDKDITVGNEFMLEQLLLQHSHIMRLDHW